MGGNRYEIGGSIISEMNLYFIRFMRRFGLKQSSRGEIDFTFGIYGDNKFDFVSERWGSGSWTPFWLKLKISDMMTTIKLLKTYGYWKLRELKNMVKKSSLDFPKLYKHLDSGNCFEQPEDMMQFLMGDKTFDKLHSKSAMDALFEGNDSPLIRDLVDPNMRCNYGGQGLENLHGIVGMVSIAGGIGSRCFPVLGGNELVIEKVMKNAKPDRRNPVSIYKDGADY